MHFGRIEQRVRAFELALDDSKALGDFGAPLCHRLVSGLLAPASSLSVDGFEGHHLLLELGDAPRGLGASILHGAVRLRWQQCFHLTVCGFSRALVRLAFRSGSWVCLGWSGAAHFL